MGACRIGMSTPSSSVTRFAKSIGGPPGAGCECDVGVNSYGAARRKSTRPGVGIGPRWRNAWAGGVWNTRDPMSASLPPTGLRGVLPVAPTVFHDDESLDLDGQRRVTEFLVDAGSVAICVLANFSEQFSLTDDERRQ